eukprot:358159-Chlamydomonas_euryale.AAC.2
MGVAEQVFTASKDGTIRLWDYHASTCLKTIHVREVVRSMVRVAWRPACSHSAAMRNWHSSILQQHAAGNQQTAAACRWRARVLQQQHAGGMHACCSSMQVAGTRAEALARGTRACRSNMRVA